NFHGPRLVDVAGGVVSLVCLAALLRVWQPRRTWHFPEEARIEDRKSRVEDGEMMTETTEPPVDPRVSFTRRQVISAWVPWIFLTIFVFLWGLPSVKEFLAPAGTRFQVPGLHEQIARDQPVVDVRQNEKATFDFNWLSATGTGI